VTDSCEHSNERLGSIKGEDFLSSSTIVIVLQTDSAPGSQ
jgi:hypothetical protein